MHLRGRTVGLALALMLVLTACSSEGNVFSLDTGQCFDDTETVQQGGELTDVPVVDCAEPHDNEVFATFDLEADSYPGDEAAQSQADSGCLDRFQDYVGVAYADSRYRILDLYPTQESWDNGDREVVCFLFDQDNAKLTGSAKGTAE